VFGAQAVILYGVPRLSADVDVTLALVPDAPERFAGEMEAARFTLRVDDPDFVRRTRVMPFVHLPTGMPLDVVLAGSGLEEEFLSRAKAVDIGGTSVPVIDLGDLIIARCWPAVPRMSTMRPRSGVCTGARSTPIGSALRCAWSRRPCAKMISCRRSTLSREASVVADGRHHPGPLRPDARPRLIPSGCFRSISRQ
jgi:hypothetical protein